MEEKAELVKIIKQKKELLRKAEEAASVLDRFVFFLADVSLEDMWHKRYGGRVPFSCNEKRGRQL